MTNQRTSLIDNLRGISVIGMILIHVNAYYLSNKLAYQLWNWTQFVVPLFIFCSSYLYFAKTRQTAILEIKDILPYLKKRISRLLIPFYVYLFFYYLLLYVTGKQFTFLSVVKSLTLTTPSNDISWLILLFTYFIFLLPILDYLALKKSSLFLFVTICSYLSAIYFLFFPSPINFKLIMWLPWLTIVIATWFIVRIESSKKQLGVFILLSALMFTTVLWSKVSLHQSLSFYNNKYPPNLYYLSYGLLTMGLLTMLLKKDVFPSVIKLFVFFMSKYSYTIFFIHFLIIFIIVALELLKYFNWVSLFLVVTILTVIIQWLMNYFFSTLKKAN